MGRAIRFRLRSGARRTLQELDRLLDDAYGVPEADLNNKDDPLEEAVYIVLSFQTNLDRFKLVWEDLRTYEQLSQRGTSLLKRRWTGLSEYFASEASKNRRLEQSRSC